MKKLFHQKKFAYLALLIWLVISLSGMHGHYCFDGSEPPVSVHFDMLNGHDEDHASLSDVHIDVDNNPSETTAVKIFNLDLPFLAIALLLIFIWPNIRSQRFTLPRTPFSWLAVTGLRPPLRAPPTLSH